MSPAGRLAPPAPAGYGRLDYDRVVVGGAFSVLFLTCGAPYSFGLFFNALIDEFDWSRASLSSVFSLYAGRSGSARRPTPWRWPSSPWRAHRPAPRSPDVPRDLRGRCYTGAA